MKKEIYYAWEKMKGSKAKKQSTYKKKGKNLSGTVYKKKPKYDDKIDHKLDGSRYYSQYREFGRYGSHPSYDDMGEESYP